MNFFNFHLSYDVPLALYLKSILALEFVVNILLFKYYNEMLEQLTNKLILYLLQFVYQLTQIPPFVKTLAL